MSITVSSPLLPSPWRFTSIARDGPHERASAFDVRWLQCRVDGEVEDVCDSRNEVRCGPQVRHRAPEGAQVSLIREETAEPKGALLALLSQPFGFALLRLVAFGLLCFAVWRIAQSILD